MREYYLYKITNTINNRIYIGMTVDPDRRWREHCRGNTGCHKLVNSMKKYGKHKFSFEIIVKGSGEYICNLEMKAIALYQTIKNGYNIHYGTTRLVDVTVDEMYTNPVYVSGFWFPCANKAMRSLRMSMRMYKNRRDKGTLHLESTQPIQKAIILTQEDMDTHVPWGSEKMREKKSVSMRGKNSGAKNGMFGKRNTTRSRAINVEGVEYPSITEAVRQTNYTKSMIEKRLKKGVTDFSYLG